MGSNLNFKNFVNEPPPQGGGGGGGGVPGGGGGRPPDSSGLTRQSSVYNLTFDELQNTIGGIGKDFGSLNMDELLKNIWSAEDNQNFGIMNGGGGGSQEGGLNRQGSLILPRTLSQKTVEEVWRDMSKEGVSKDGGCETAGFGVPQRQQTLGEITLEDFLVRAGVVREEAQLASTNPGIFGDLWHPVNSTSGLGFEFQQQQPNRNAGLMNVGISDGTNQIASQSPPNLQTNVNGMRPNPQQLENHHQLQQQQRQHQQQILPKQLNPAYGSAMGVPTNGQLGSPRIRAGNTSPGGGLGMVSLASNGSPAVSSDGLAKSNVDTSYASPVPYVFTGGLRGRRSAVLEKVVERRQKRMIKNRESAARSRARKQAYTMELEAEVATLKEENELLEKKQVEMMETQKNQALEMMKHQTGGKRQCLRRMQTGPW